ncbi:ATP-binding protein [Dysgonomonas sp. Marseille-P4677]|uniref:ATP-binding protein n=1 Tax=Dysgonomonas sp. Marseille-P4677 TaxID=2364790 RepID=UPI001913C8B9|nr:ATP-binding protein [Dysgonomonas sp. Marseille-P4677]MBK5721325.1 ATP-binding protein [Dysgonomonas sp. Marseille-P4677]
MKAKIFYGPARSGKTATANILHNFFGSNKAIYYNGQKYNADALIEQLSYDIKEETRLIIVDDVPEDFGYMAFAHWLPEGGTFIQNRKGQSKKPIVLNDIYFVFTTNCKPNDNSRSFTERFEQIEFPSQYFFSAISKERKSESVITKEFTNWANNYFSTESPNTDCLIPLKIAMNDFCYDSNCQWTTNKFSKALKAYCDMADHISELNPDKFKNRGGRIIREHRAVATEMIYVKTK